MNKQINAGALKAKLVAAASTLDSINMIGSLTPIDTDEFARLQDLGLRAKIRLDALQEVWDMVEEIPADQILHPIQQIAVSLVNDHGRDALEDRVRILAMLTRAGLVDADHPDSIADREMIDQVQAQIRLIYSEYDM